MDYNTLITKLKGTLESQVTELKAVYDGFPDGNLSVYPCATIYPLGKDNNFLDLRDIRRSVTVVIRIYVNLEDTENESQKVLRDIVDKVENVIEKNITLDNTVDWIRPMQDRFSFSNQNAKIYYNDITCIAEMRFNRYA